MKFTTHRLKFNQCLQNVYRAITTRTTIPILSGIKLEVEESGLRLTGSDSDITIQATIPAVEDDQVLVEVEQTGSVVLPSRYLGEIIRKLPGTEFSMTSDEQHLTKIQSGSAEFVLNGLDPLEYPKLPVVQEERIFTVSLNALRSMIQQTVFATSNTESRPILTGVLVQIEQEKIRFMATDSHRFAKSETSLSSPSNSAADGSVVIPGRSLEELSKLLNETDEVVDVVLSKSHILVRNSHILFISRLLEGSYPDTSRIVPSQAEHHLFVQNKSLTSAVERASLLAREGKNNIVRLIVNREEMEIQCQVPEVGEVRETIPIQSLNDGDAYQIAINAKYLLDALHALQDQEVHLSYTGPMSPFLLRKKETDEVLQLVLPVRI